MKQVIVFPRGQLSDKDRRSLARTGVTVVEADDPSAIVSVLPVPAMPADEMLAVSLEALAASSFPAHQEFVKRLAAAVRARVPKAKPPGQ